MYHQDSTFNLTNIKSTIKPVYTLKYDLQYLESNKGSDSESRRRDGAETETEPGMSKSGGGFRRSLQRIEEAAEGGFRRKRRR